MKIILFIGHHKVGSTSLQDYLARNAVALAQAGILYPATDFEGLALMSAMAAGRHQPDGPLPINAREPHNALAFRMLADHQGGKVPNYHKRLPGQPQMIHAIRQQVSFFTPHTMILAAEVFANFNAVAPELIHQLVGFFPEAEFTVTATLRRIDEYLASWHGQRLKFGHTIAPLRTNGVEPYISGIHFDYRLMVEGWLQALPEARVILRNYTEVRNAGGSVADFITQNGLKVPKGLARERRENDSLHRGVYEIVRRGITELPRDQASALRAEIRDLTPKLRLPDSTQIELFGVQNRQHLVEQFAPINAYLGGVVGRAAFFDDLDQARQVLPVSEETVYAPALQQIRRLLRKRGDEAADKRLDDLSAQE
ncbi:MAG: hypothetical protein COB16_11690 [Rhodobacteraceae bacterium]|nr:MAG: hypothetical protein COB16_11360 [Paracoccaceae bacterium]PCJ07337.1 MAG: hypothetical protein COB16_11690 [Paracoccaceae bacterium]